MEVNICLQKFKILFEKIIEGNFEISEYYSNNLLKYLKDRSENSAGKKLLNAPRFSDLIFQCLKSIQNASTTVKTFVIEVFTLICQNELQFDKLHLQGFQNCLIAQCIFNNISTPSTALCMACMKLSHAQISHNSGLNLMVDQKIWAKVLTPKVHKPNCQLSKSIYRFISKLVWTLNDQGQEADLMELLLYIANPLADSDYMKLQVLDEDNERVMADSIMCYLYAIHEIFSVTDHLRIPNKVKTIIWEELVEKRPVLHTISSLTRLPDVATLMSDTLFRFYFNMSSTPTVSNSDFCNKQVSSFYNTLTGLLKKRMVPATLTFVVNCNIFWSNYCKNVTSTFVSNGQLLDVRNQFILLIIVPLLTFARQKNNTMSESVERLSVKLGKLGSEHIIRAGYMLREINEGCDKRKSAIHMLKEIFKLKGHLSESQAGILFQGLYHVLGHYVLCDEDGRLILNENPLTPDDVKLLSLLLAAIKMILTDHQISWYENLEVISLQTDLMNLLKLNILPTKLILQAIELVNLSIGKFLSPDLSLLVESKQGSTLNETSAMMKAYIQHDEWEVRDSALTLLLSCTEVAFVKYVPLQKLIAEYNLMVLASQVALGDPEYYPQVTAMKCLAAATKIKCIWRDVTAANLYLYMHLFNTLRQSPEGMVRKEVVHVLTEVYINQKVSQQFTVYMYKVMTVAALDDLHWEVQLAALKFWKRVIQNHLINRGMIDGKFPAVTFCKERRKIVVLNDEEIKKQLTSIMLDLSSKGCLTVLHQSLTEDNLEVMEQAYIMSRELINILEFYKFDKVSETYIIPDQNAEVKEEIDDDAEDAMDITYTTTQAIQDTIIDYILNTKQTDLIMNCFESNVDDVQPKTSSCSFINDHKRQNIKPNTFMTAFKVTDYTSVIKGKKDWDSEATNIYMLLDEILTLNTNPDIRPECQ